MADTRDVLKKETEAPAQTERTRDRRVFSPSVDIVERKGDILLIADMPGVDEKSVDVTLEKNVLSIYGKVDAEIPENQRLQALEYGIGDYQRSFTLSDEVAKDKIQASVKNGVLRLVLPKVDEAPSRKIVVAAGV